MKRHPALANLSRDHHTALRLARDLENAGRGGGRDPVRTVETLRKAWQTELAGHFAWEERWFGRILAETMELELLLAEHWNLRKHIDAVLAPTPAPADLNQRLGHIGALLRAHVRWEERVLFPAVERVASEDDLAQMLAAADQPASGF